MFIFHFLSVGFCIIAGVCILLSEKEKSVKLYFAIWIIAFFNVALDVIVH